MCWPRGNNRGRPEKYPRHPKAVYLSENALLDAVCRFYADRLFGPERRAPLAAELARLDDDTAKQRDAERRRLERVITDLERRQGAVLRQAQDADLDDPYTNGLRQTYNDLETEKTAAMELSAAEQDEPSPDVDTALLDALPALTNAPQPRERERSEAMRTVDHAADG